jgi:hypothetical protein
MRVELAGKVCVARGGAVTPVRELRTPPGDCGVVERSTKERQFFKSNVQPAARVLDLQGCRTTLNVLG